MFVSNNAMILMLILDAIIISMLVFNNINDYLEYHYKLWTKPDYVGTRQLMSGIILSI